MGERKHKAEGGEKKVIQPQHEEERIPEKHPAEALRLLAANVASPSDIQTLQRAAGNKVVTNMIQRHHPTGIEVDIDLANNKLGDHSITYTAGYKPPEYEQIKKKYGPKKAEEYLTGKQLSEGTSS